MMTNVKWTREGNILTITVDTSKEFGPSKSGKTIIVASSGGNEALGDNLIMGLNIYRKIEDK